MQFAISTPAEPAATRTEQAVDELRLEILRSVLPPGTRITEEGLATRYSLNRTPVREALRLLTRESPLVRVPRAHYEVAAVNLDEMEDLYTMRVALEARVAARIAARGADAPALRELIEFWGSPPAPIVPDASLVFADEHFHETLAAASGSTVLQPLLRNITHRLHVLSMRDFVDPQRIVRTYEQHAAILHALLDADGRLAASLLRAHIWQSYVFVRASTHRGASAE
ncbi:MAG: GntR family transcriptional regulator [Candidatus Rokubacteria bacterium]|nr:GntR family transcriptional regulator [Candidatus Rokubacteria bacterium]